MSRRSFAYVVDDSNAHVDSKLLFGFTPNKFAAHRDIDYIQRDLLTVFGSTFVGLVIVLLWYWFCLKRTQLFERIEKLREEHSSKPVTAATPRQQAEQIRQVASPYLVQPIPIKMEAVD